MLDFAEIAFFIAIGAIGALLVAWAFGVLVTRKAQQLNNLRANMASRTAKKTDEDEMYAALADAMLLFKSGKNATDVLKEIGLKYPRLTTRLIAKVARGDMPAELTDFLGGGEK